MKVFKFKAKTPQGRVISGSIKAKSRNELVRRMAVKNVEPLIIEEKNSFFLGSGSSVNSKHLVAFTRQLGFLISAGVPIIKALHIIQDVIYSHTLKSAVKDIVNSLETGSTFSSALSQHTNIFNQLFVSMVASGEKSGNLDKSLKQLAGYVEESAQLKNKIKKAMMYPVFVLVIGVAVTIGIMVKVVPTFVSIFKDSDVPLPFITKMLMNISDIFVNNIIIILFLVIIAPFFFVLYLLSPQGRKLKDQLLMALPVFGNLCRQNSVARFSRTFSCLMSSGVNIIEALKTSSNASNNFHIEKAIKSVSNQVVKGKPLGDSLRQHAVMPSLVSSMASIGEETGNVDATMEKVAEFYEENVKTTADNMASLIQPFLIVFLGGIIGFVVIALYLPIIKMPGVMGGI